MKSNSLNFHENDENDENIESENGTENAILDGTSTEREANQDGNIKSNLNNSNVDNNNADTQANDGNEDSKGILIRKDDKTKTKMSMNRNEKRVRFSPSTRDGDEKSHEIPAHMYTQNAYTLDSEERLPLYSQTYVPTLHFNNEFFRLNDFDNELLQDQNHNQQQQQQQHHGQHPYSNQPIQLPNSPSLDSDSWTSHGSSKSRQSTISRTHNHRNKTKRKRKSFAPAILFFLVILIFVVSFLVIMVPRLKSASVTLKPPELYKNSDLIGFVFVLYSGIMMLICLLRSVYTHPGLVPHQFPWNPECDPPVTTSSLAKSITYKASTEPLLETSRDRDKDNAFQTASNTKIVRRNNTSKESSSDGLSSLDIGIVDPFLAMKSAERKKDGKARFCKTCNVYKPDRCHHCSAQNECILELDHYCPWIRSSIGYYNKKHFLLMVIYGWISLLAYIITLFPEMAHALEIGSDVNLLIAIVWFFAAVFVTALSFFLGFQLWMVANAYTTIEFCEKRRAPPQSATWQGCAVRDLYKFSPYDLGLYKNFKHVFGPNVLLWLIPTRHGMPTGSTAGTEYELNPRHPLYQMVRDQRSEISKDSDKSKPHEINFQ